MPSRRGASELTIDHSVGPGLSPEFLASMGLDPTMAVPGGSKLECATKTCAHCGSLVVLNPERARARGSCWRCNQYLCDPCAADNDTALKCRPLAQQIDEAGNRAVLGLPPLGRIGRG